MAAVFKLKEITISGFRGYGEKEESLDLSFPATIIVGGNRSGKSSTLNAIEWALYGGEVVGAKCGIEERKGWIVGNMECETAAVDLVMETASGEITVHREMDCGRRRGTTFYFIDESGKKSEDEGKLWRRLGLGPKDFMSTAYLHQEMVRDLVTATPSVRKSALDRLLGVADLRNLLEGIKAVKVSSYESDLGDTYKDLEELIDARTQSYKEDLADAKEEAEEMGLTTADRKLARLKEMCAEAVEELEKLAGEADEDIGDIEVPAHAEDYDEYEKEAKKAARKLTKSNPGMKTRKKLDKERRVIDAALSAYLGAKEEVDDLNREKREIEKKHGDAGELQERKALLEGDLVSVELKIKAVSERIAVIRETIVYLEELPSKGEKTPCPACEQDVIPEKLLESLKKEIEGMGSEVEDLEKQRLGILEELNRVKELIGKLLRLTDEKIPEAEERLKEAIKGLEGAVGKKIGNKDPEAVANERLEEIEEEIEKNEKALEKYLSHISEVEDELDRTECIATILTLQKKIKRIGSVIKSQEWKEMNAARNELNKEIGLVRVLSDAVEEALGEKSRKKMEDAADTILDVYKSLVDRPDFEGIEIDAETFDVYATGNGQREKLITFFNQGDMNCAALSIFLALGSSSDKEEGLAFLMLDDPSQSLDREQKKKLAKVLNEAGKESQLVLATMDSELADDIDRVIKRRKKTYRFGKWRSPEGPSISED